jgi:hypothetical protein
MSWLNPYGPVRTSNQTDNPWDIAKRETQNNLSRQWSYWNS